jgi:hypothetical protein
MRTLGAYKTARAFPIITEPHQNLKVVLTKGRAQSLGTATQAGRHPSLRQPRFHRPVVAEKH